MSETTSTPAEEPKPTPVFGSGSAFGAGSGFAGFTGVSSTSAPAAATTAEGEDGDDEGAAPEEECQAEFKPVVQLPEVEAQTGEEDEEALLDLKCKLYRFDGDSNEWKERGIGQMKLLQHKENKKVRLLMRQDKTGKVRANHIVMPSTSLQEHSGSDKAWVWSAVDFAEEEQKIELFCVRFGTSEKAAEFKAKFEEAGNMNGELLGGAVATAKKEGDEEADKLAGEVADKAAVAEEGDEAESKPTA